MRKCRSTVSLWTIWLRLQWKVIPRTTFMTNPSPSLFPFPTHNNHFLQLMSHPQQHSCYCQPITECRFPWGNGKLTQGIYLLAKLRFLRRLLCVHRYFSSHESQHFPAERDLENNPESILINRHINTGPERHTYPRLQNQFGITPELQLMSSEQTRIVLITDFVNISKSFKKIF